jgi:hypothetical protein
MLVLVFGFVFDVDRHYGRLAIARLYREGDVVPLGPVQSLRRKGNHLSLTPMAELQSYWPSGVYVRQRSRRGHNQFVSFARVSYSQWSFDPWQKTLRSRQTAN